MISFSLRRWRSSKRWKSDRSIGCSCSGVSDELLEPCRALQSWRSEGSESTPSRTKLGFIVMIVANMRASHSGSRMTTWVTG